MHAHIKSFPERAGTSKVCRQENEGSREQKKTRHSAEHRILYTVQMARAKETLIIAKLAKTGPQRWVDIQREVYRHILFIQGEGVKIVKP